MLFHDCDYVKIRLVCLNYPDQHHPTMSLYVRMYYSQETIDRYKLLYGGIIQVVYDIETDDALVQHIIFESIDERDITQCGNPYNTGTVAIITMQAFERIINLRVINAQLKSILFDDKIDEHLLSIAKNNVESHLTVLEFHKNRVEHTISLLNEEIDELNAL